MPFSTTTLPRRIVVIGQPRISQPSHTLWSAAWRSARLKRFRTLGSISTMSASLPGASAPLRGYIPRIFAAFAAVTSTNRSSDIPRLTTPSVHVMPTRSSVAALPPTVSSMVRPESFTGREQNSTSVATVESGPSPRPRHNASPSSRNLSEG